MVKNIEAETVAFEWIQRARLPVNDPVSSKLLGAKHQHLFIAKLEVANDGEGCVSFAQADAIGENAAIILLDLVNG